VGERWMRRKAIPAEDSICCRLYNLWRKLNCSKAQAWSEQCLQCSSSVTVIPSFTQWKAREFISSIFYLSVSALLPVPTPIVFAMVGRRLRAQRDEHSVLLVSRLNIKDCELRKRNKQQSF